MRKRQQLFFGLRLVSDEFQHPTIQTKIVQSFGNFYIILYKGSQPTRRKDSTQTVIRTSRRLDSFLYEAAQNFEVVSNIFKYSELKLKNPKPIAVDVLFKAYSIYWYHSRADPMWPDGTFKGTFS